MNAGSYPEEDVELLEFPGLGRVLVLPVSLSRNGGARQGRRLDMFPSRPGRVAAVSVEIFGVYG